MDELDNSNLWASQIMEGELKEAINLFIWRWGHPRLTLGQAEKMAVSIFDMLSEKPSDCIEMIEQSFQRDTYYRGNTKEI